jgi:transposase
MEEYIGLDVSMKETAVSIRRAGERIWRGKCASDPSIVAELIRKRAPSAKRVVFGMVLSFPAHRRVTGDLHRCAPC